MIRYFLTRTAPLSFKFRSSFPFHPLGVSCFTLPHSGSSLLAALGNETHQVAAAAAEPRQGRDSYRRAAVQVTVEINDVVFFQ